jgi:hypothetical protein
MNINSPISIKVSYIDKTGNPVETQFRSLHKASKVLGINIPTLKELSYGGSPRLKAEYPKDLKVVRIPTLPKPVPKSKQPKSQQQETIKYYCEICDKYLKPKSKYEHVVSKTHLKHMGSSIPHSPP